MIWIIFHIKLQDASYIKALNLMSLNYIFDKNTSYMHNMDEITPREKWDSITYRRPKTGWTILVLDQRYMYSVFNITSTSTLPNPWAFDRRISSISTEVSADIKWENNTWKLPGSITAYTTSTSAFGLCCCSKLLPEQLKCISWGLLCNIIMIRPAKNDAIHTDMTHFTSTNSQFADAVMNCCQVGPYGHAY